MLAGELTLSGWLCAGELAFVMFFPMVDTLTHSKERHLKNKKEISKKRR